jgi:signal peptidase I
VTDDFPPAERPPSLDDPRFAEDILARARRRADLGDREDTTAAGGADTGFAAVPAPVPDPATSPPTHDEPRPDRARRRVRDDVGRGATNGAEPEPPELQPDIDPDAPDDTPSSRRTRNLVEWVAVAVAALVVAFLIRAFLLQAFYIPSESMEPTLVKNDRILVNKLSYKLHDVNRGDLIVFEKPPSEAASDINDLIKRVVALPSETIEQRGTQIYIDNRLLTEPYLPAGLDPGTTITWVEGCANPRTETNRCTIPEGHVWVMGDNRPHSRDSRFFGPIDEDLIVGRAFVKVWPLGKIGFL